MNNSPESFDEFCRRMHCAHVSADELMGSLYDARQSLELTRLTLLVANKEINKLTAENKMMKQKLNHDSQNLEIECLRETVRLREAMISRLFGASADMLHELNLLLPKKTKFLHHTRLLDDVGETMDEASRLVAAFSDGRGGG